MPTAFPFSDLTGVRFVFRDLEGFKASGNDPSTPLFPSPLIDCQRRNICAVQYSAFLLTSPLVDMVAKTLNGLTLCKNKMV